MVILNSEGICVASSDHRKTGCLVDSNFVGNKSAAKTYINIGQKNIPFVCGKNKYSYKELSLIKNLAKVTLEQYFSQISRPLSSIDQFIAQVVGQPLNSYKLAMFDDEAQSLGLNLEVERVAILVKINNFTEENLSLKTDQDNNREDVIESWKQKIVTAISGFFTVKTDIIAAYTGGGRFAFFKELSGGKERFVRHMKSAYLSIFGSLIDPKKENLIVGFSDCHSGINGLHESYQEALQALQLGYKLTKKKNQSYYYGDLGTMRILTEESIEKKKTFAHEILKPLNKETLRLTLETFLNENMDVKKTAEKLRIHPNTVNYRLSKIAESLQLDPRVFKQAFELRIALLTDKIFT